MTTPRLQVSRRQRATPYTPCVEAHGVSDFSVVNHTLLPKGFGRTPAEDYWHLREHVQLWDVGCQRQVEVHGSDAARLVQWITPRDLRQAQVGQCLYAPIIDERAGMLNDPIILKLAQDRFWLSIADSDLLLWVNGLARGCGMNVDVFEPDVWPMAVQGPAADTLMERVFPGVSKLRFFRFDWFDFAGTSLLIARSGFSKQGGFEIYLHDPSLGVALWETLWAAGQDIDVAPGCPNLIERIEGGLLSYGNEMTRENNPLECNLDDYCTLDGSLDFVGCEALLALAKDGPQRRIRGVLIEGDALGPPRHPWSILDGDLPVGQVTSAAWSPRFRSNVALGMVDRVAWDGGRPVTVVTDAGERRVGTIVPLPFQDKNKPE